MNQRTANILQFVDMFTVLYYLIEQLYYVIEQEIKEHVNPSRKEENIRSILKRPF